PVVRSAWLEDSARAGRKLPLADYMVDGIFVQKGTLTASFSAAAAATPKKVPPSTTGSAMKRGSFSGPYSSSSSSSSSRDHSQASPGGTGPSSGERRAQSVHWSSDSRGSNTGSNRQSQASSKTGKAKALHPAQYAATAPIPSTTEAGSAANFVRSEPAAAGWSEVASPSVGRLADGRRREINKSSAAGMTGRDGGQWQRPASPESAHRRKAVAAAAGRALPGDGKSGAWRAPAGGGSRGGSNAVGAAQTRGMSSLSVSQQRQQQQRQQRQQQRQPYPSSAASAGVKPPSSHAGDKGSDGTTSTVNKGSGGPLNADEAENIVGGGASNEQSRAPQPTATCDGDRGTDGSGGNVSRETSDFEFPPPIELPEAWPHEAGGRSTKDDPAFMKTFFQNSRLHFIGVGRAHAVKVVNAGLAARALPGAAQPTFGGRALGRGETRVILHVDMDCFFVSVLVRNRPELRGKPVAVAHNASNAKGAGSSEISSCNYPARAKGLRAGMFMMQAKKLCPELIVLRYDFEAYTEASEKMYGVFLQYAPVVMAVSCDEAFLELAEGTDPMAAASQARGYDFFFLIRRRIFEETGCSASAGASNNMLLARLPIFTLNADGSIVVGSAVIAGATAYLDRNAPAVARMATKEAKPDGQFWLPTEIAMRHMGPLPVQDLPGVGWKLRKRLNDEGLNVCSDLWRLSLNQMQKGLGLGEKTGRALWEACRGIDKRPVQAPPDRKSIGAEVNYGVRFDTQAQAVGFLSELAVELSRRMAAEGVLGRALTLKIMKQKDGVGLPRKYLGHGICDARSKLLNLGRATADAGTLKSHALHLLKEAKVPPDKIRGIGLQMTRLVSAAGGDGVGGVGGASFGGGKGGPFGALRGWLVKPGGVEEEQGQEEGSTDAPQGAAARAAPAERPAPAPASAPATAPAMAVRSETSKEVEETSGNIVHPQQAGGTICTLLDLSGEAEDDDGTSASLQTLAAATAEAATSGGAVSPRNNKRRREERRDDQAPPPNDGRSPPGQ
ncbi:unnamed protein product, partial [Hapterophycus canaliculatus]